MGKKQNKTPTSKPRGNGKANHRAIAKTEPALDKTEYSGATHNGLLGYEGLDPGDFIVPRFKIVQPVSREGTPGYFRSNVTGEELSEIDCVVLTVRKGMVLFGEGADGRAVCRSRDALTPDPSLEYPIADFCNVVQNRRLVPVCDKAKFMDGIPPECKLTYNVLGLRLEDDLEEPFLITLHGTSLRPVRMFLSACRQRRRHLFDIRCALRLSETVNTKGRFYVASFEDIEDVEPSGRYARLFEELRAYDPATTFEAEESDAADFPPIRDDQTADEAFAG